MAETTTKQRKPKARQKDIVLGAIDERLQVLEEQALEKDGANIARIRELMDELRRSLGSGKETEE